MPIRIGLQRGRLCAASDPFAAWSSTDSPLLTQPGSGRRCCRSGLLTLPAPTDVSPRAQRPAPSATSHFTRRPRTESRPAPRRPRRVALALAVLAVLATVAPEQAVAQSEITLVGNAGQPTGERHTASFQGAVDHAQQFATGSNAAGYTLTKVEFLSNDAQSHKFSAQLCEANNTGGAAVPDPMNCQTLSTTSSFAQGSVVVFTPPAGMTITLAASTRYVVVLSENNSPSAQVDIFSTQADNQNGETGWTLANVFDWKQNGTTWMKQGSGRDALIMDVKGYAGTPTNNLAHCNAGNTNELWCASLTVGSTTDGGFTYTRLCFRDWRIWQPRPRHVLL